LEKESMKNRIKYSMADRIRVALIKEGCFYIFDRLVYSIAWTFKKRKDEVGWIDVDELAAIGMAKIKEVFLKNPNHYDPAKGAALSTVIYKIAGTAMIDFLRQEGRMYKATKAYYENAAINEKTLEELKQIFDTEVIIEQAVAELENEKRPYRDVINEFYGIGCNYRHSKTELANKHGVTRQTISNWIKKGLHQLEQPLIKYSKEREGVGRKKYM
jgi:RNA polymerase sigma factor (sigma-70 family)